MDIFTFIAFGVDLDSLEREEARARALSRALARARSRPTLRPALSRPLLAPSREQTHAFARAFDAVQSASEKRFWNPLYLPCKWLRLTRSEREIARGVKVIDEFAYSVIARKRRAIAADDGAAG